MPPVILAAAGAAFASIGATSFVSAFALNFIGSLVLSAVSRALMPSASSGSSGAKKVGSSITINTVDSDASHKHIYGMARVGGAYRYVGSTSKNRYLHYIVVLAAHEVEAIDEVWFDSVVIPNDALDSNGNVISGKYSGKARIRKHLGSPNQVADPVMVSEVSEWTDDHKLRGRAYIYVRLDYNVNVFTTGRPNTTAVVRGKKLFDPRDNVTRWGLNLELFAYDFFTQSSYGFGAAASRFSVSQIAAGANVCDEIVATASVSMVVTAARSDTDVLDLSGTMLQFQHGARVQVTTTGSLPGGISAGTNYYVIPWQYGMAPRIKLASTLANAVAGIPIDVQSTGTGTHTVTKNGEPRYWGSGVMDTVQGLENNIQDMLSGMGGRVVFAGGNIRIQPAVWTTPSISLGLGDLAAPMSVETKISIDQRFNSVQGTYSSSINNWQPSNYPKLFVQGYVDQDGGVEAPLNLDLPYTTSATTAQRIIKIELRRARQEIVMQSVGKLKVFQAQTGDVVQLTSSSDGWSAKNFEVTSMGLALGGADNPTLTCPFILRETDPSIFDWSATEEASIDPAPNSNLPDAFTVEAVTGLGYTSRAVTTPAGDNVYNLVLTWDPHPNTFVTQGGSFDLEFKLSADSDWRSYPPVPGAQDFADIPTNSVNVEYDLRIRAVNNVGFKSDWTTIINIVVGASGGVTTDIDDGLVTDAVTSVQDDGLVTDSVTSIQDDGFIV